MHNKYILALRLMAIACCGIFLGGVQSAFAQAQAGAVSIVLSGVPYVQDSGIIVLDGKEITLWGIERLAPDQQCWQAETAWCCGEFAAMALKHFVQGRVIECTIKTPAEGGFPASAQCVRTRKKEEKVDIAEHMVSHGWAMDKKDISGGHYAAAESEARERRRGAWSSKFQSAQDWKDGVMRFIGEGDAEGEKADKPEQKEEKGEEE